MIPIIPRRTGYKEDDQVLRKKYGLPDDWKPEEPPVRKWRRSDFVNQDNHAFFEVMERNEYLEPDDVTPSPEEDSQ